MLTDRERLAWHEILRRLVEDDDFRRSFRAVDRRTPGGHLPPARYSTVLVALPLVMLLLTGPNPPTTAEIDDRRQPPPPRESSAGLVGSADAHMFPHFDVSVPPPRSASAAA